MAAIVIWRTVIGHPMIIAVKSVERADHLLRTVIELDGATASKLAETLEMPLSSVYDYLHDVRVAWLRRRVG